MVVYKEVPKILEKIKNKKQIPSPEIIRKRVFENITRKKEKTCTVQVEDIPKMDQGQRVLIKYDHKCIAFEVEVIEESATLNYKVRAA